MRRNYCDGVPLQPPCNGFLRVVREELDILKQQHPVHQALHHPPSFTFGLGSYTHGGRQGPVAECESGLPVGHGLRR